jgi:5-methylcytosine-specific restriction endonuclease McrA
MPRGRFRRISGKIRSWCRDCERPGHKARNATRRCRTRGSYKGEDVERLMVLQSGMCASCRSPFHVVGYHVDHRVPLARGGLNVKENIQLLCPRCNLKKGRS